MQCFDKREKGKKKETKKQNKKKEKRKKKTKEKHMNGTRGQGVFKNLQTILYISTEEHVALLSKGNFALTGARETPGHLPGGT